MSYYPPHCYLFKYQHAPMNLKNKQKLKAVVPSPVLKSCLDDMTYDKKETGNPFDESDDEDDSSSRKKKLNPSMCSSNDQCAGLLCIKEGRNSNNILYFVNQTTLHNNGEGLIPEERNTLVGNFEESKIEKEALVSTLKQTIAETAKLSSEPTNEEANAKLEAGEREMVAVRKNLEESLGLKENEQHKKQTKKRIDCMVNYWRKRKRTCMVRW